MTKDEMKDKISIALKDPILQQGFEIICKENAELKKENAELKSKNCWKTCEYAEPKSQWISQHIQDVEQITKAKELLTRFVMASVHFNGRETDLVEEAGQFISEVEK